MLTVTVDTQLWLSWFDCRDTGKTEPTAVSRAAFIDGLLSAGRDGRVQVFASNRVFYPDSRRMDTGQCERLRGMLSNAGVAIAGSSFRFGVSAWSGGDALSGHKNMRTAAEMEVFANIVGGDPVERHPLPRKGTLSNKVGDYDALRDHFTAGRDVFITEDRCEPFDHQRRRRFKLQLALVIQGIDDFRTQHLELFT